MNDPPPEAQLAGFIAKYSPEIGELAQAILVEMRARLPGAVELVYDNYNALVIGFGPTERASEAIFSIALYPRWINLFFLKGASLTDPGKILKGSGNVVRSVVISGPKDLDQPVLKALITDTLKRAKVPIDSKAKRRMVIKSVSAKQRPRRPAGRPSK